MTRTTIATRSRPRAHEDRSGWIPYYEHARDARDFAACPACRGRADDCDRCSGLGTICTRKPDGWERIVDGVLERTRDDGATWQPVPRARKLRPRVWLGAVPARSKSEPRGVPLDVQIAEVARSIRVYLGIEDAHTVADVRSVRASRSALRRELRERLRLAKRALDVELEGMTRARDRERAIRRFARDHQPTYDALLAVEPLLPRGEALTVEGRPPELEGGLFAAARETLGVKLPALVAATYAHLEPGPDLDAFVDEEYRRIREQTKRRG